MSQLQYGNATHRCLLAGAGWSYVAPSHQQSWPSCHAGSPLTSEMQPWLAFGGCLSSASCIMTLACCGLPESSQATQKCSGAHHMACKTVADWNEHKLNHVSAPPEHDAAYFVHSKTTADCTAGYAWQALQGPTIERTPTCA